MFNLLPGMGLACKTNSALIALHLGCDLRIVITELLICYITLQSMASREILLESNGN